MSLLYNCKTELTGLKIFINQLETKNSNKNMCGVIHLQYRYRSLPWTWAGSEFRMNRFIGTANR